MKKIVIAPDSFKGNLTSLQVASCLEKGVKRVLPKAKCIKVPMLITANYGWLAKQKTAVIEMVEASGLPLVKGRDKNPLKTTTYGTGQLILDAIDKGAKKIIIGLGGSATNDGGTGMAQAFGVKFLNANGREIKELGSGGMLAKIASIDTTSIDPRIAKTKIVVACDVENPLCGKKGASHVFGPQKGATPKMVLKLDENLKNLGKLMKRDLGKDVARIPGAGAAGGLGAGMLAFTNAKLESGIDIVLKATNLAKYINGADLVLTGEGRVDFQTAFGKTPSGVAKAAKSCGVPVIAIGGALSDDARLVFDHGIDAIESAAAKDMTLEVAIKNSKQDLANAAERVIRMILIGKKMAAKK